MSYASSKIDTLVITGVNAKPFNDRIKGVLAVELKDKNIIDIKFSQSGNQYSALIIYEN